MITSSVVVRFTVEGWHCWPGAPDYRAYLRERHRHLFHVEVQVAVNHHEREIEFHDLLDYSRRRFGGGEFGAASCETMATDLIDTIRVIYGEREIRVSVFEDGECGAVVQYRPEGLFHD